jgi:hypothetical protein
VVTITPPAPSPEPASDRNTTPFVLPLIAILITSQIIVAIAIVATRLLRP